MQSNFITAYLIPLSLMVVMFGVGLSLTLNDFTRVTRRPLAALVGTLGHFFVLPVVGFLCVIVFHLKPEFAVGLILLVACGGGAVSNALTYIAKGDTALSITLTSISLPASIVSIPFLTNLAIGYYMPESAQTVSLPVFKTIAQLAVTLWLPIALGMMVRRYSAGFAGMMDRPVRLLSILFMFTLLVSIMYIERERLLWAFAEVGPATFLLNAVAIVFGVVVSRIVNLNFQEVTTIGIELGIQNSATAMFVALSILATPAMSIPAAVYTVIAFVNVGIFISLVRFGAFGFSDEVRYEQG